MRNAELSLPAAARAHGPDQDGGVAAAPPSDAATSTPALVSASTAVRGTASRGKPSPQTTVATNASTAAAITAADRGPGPDEPPREASSAASTSRPRITRPCVRKN